MNMWSDRINASDKRFLPDNAPASVQLRKTKNTLMVVGTGILVFGVWTALKFLGMLFLTRKGIIESVRNTANVTEFTISDELLFGILLVFAVIYLLFGLGARAIIGFSAIAEARGRRRGKLYIPLTAVFILLNFLELINIIRQIVTGDIPENRAGGSLVITLIIDLTSMIMMVQMLAAVHSIRKHRATEEQAVE